MCDYGANIVSVMKYSFSTSHYFIDTLFYVTIFKENLASQDNAWFQCLQFSTPLTKKVINLLWQLILLKLCLHKEQNSKKEEWNVKLTHVTHTLDKLLGACTCNPVAHTLKVIIENVTLFNEGIWGYGMTWFVGFNSLKHLTAMIR